VIVAFSNFSGVVCDEVHSRKREKKTVLFCFIFSLGLATSVHLWNVTFAYLYIVFCSVVLRAMLQIKIGHVWISIKILFRLDTN